jgi:Tfp pilus assembly protein PilX
MSKPSFPSPRRQSGAVLFIALIVLVAMTLAGIAIMRSVDTGNQIAGNVAFKQGTLTSADRGFDVAFDFLKNNVTTALLDNDYPAEAYYASVSRDPAVDPPNWSDAGTWTDAKIVGTDAAGNTISYVIHRMCYDIGSYQGQYCATTKKSGGAAGNSQTVGGTNYQPIPMVYFRVTVRVQGPRDTMSMVQSNVGVQF